MTTTPNLLLTAEQCDLAVLRARDQRGLSDYAVTGCEITDQHAVYFLDDALVVTVDRATGAVDFAEPTE